MAFNPVLQSQIQPEQTPVQSDSTSFAAGALGTVLNIGSGILQGQQKQQAAQQKAFVTEKVSSAALPLADLFSNAGSGKGVRIAQQTREYENSLREQGFSDAEIVEVYKIANSASGTSYSAANKAERSAIADQIKNQESFRKEYTEMIPWIPSEYLVDGRVPVDGPEMQAAFLAAKASKAQNDAIREQANTQNAVANANMSQIQLQSRADSEALSTQVTNLLSQSVAQYDTKTPEGRQLALRDLFGFRSALQTRVNGMPSLTRADKDSFLSGMNAMLTALEDNLTGKTMADISAKQMGAWIQTAKDIALSDNPNLLQAYIYSGLGIQVQSTDVQVLKKETLDRILSTNPNAKNVGNSIQATNLTPEEKTNLARETWTKLRTPVKPLEDLEIAIAYAEDWANVLAAPLPADQKELFGPNGLYLKSLDVFRDKKNADNFGIQVLGNPDFIQQFTAASGRAISTYIPVVMNQVEGYNVKVKEQVKLTTKTGAVQFRLDIPERLSSNPMSVSDTFRNPSFSAIDKLNTILRKQYEAAVQLDRVNGGNLAEQIRNTQLRTASLFIQVDAN
jgi:hypothetical protein